jgi:hypothetical protein
MEVLQFSVSKRRLNNSSTSRSALVHSRSIDNSRRSPDKLYLSSSCNMWISNRRNNSLSSSRSVDNNRRSPGKLRLSSSYNMRISNRRNNSLSSSRSIDNSRRSPDKLRLSSSYNMMISNRRNNSLSSNRRRSAGNLPLRSRCNMYSSLCNKKRIPGILHCRRGIRPGNLCLKMRFLTVLLG